MPNNVNYGTGLIMGFVATISGVLMLGYGMLVDSYGHMMSLNVLILLAGVMTISSYLVPSSIDMRDHNGKYITE